MKAPLPANEAQRLVRLRAYEVLDTPSEAAFDDLTLLAAQICGVPTAMVSLVDEKRQCQRHAGIYGVECNCAADMRLFIRHLPALH